MRLSIIRLFKGYYKLCECGCLELIPIINKHGNFARFKNHHNTRGKNHPSWKGGRYFHEISGYWFKYNPLHPFCHITGYIREHRYKLEIYLSILNGIPTYIHPSLEVHHLDGNKENNHWSNLQILTKSEHTSLSMTERHRKNRELDL